MALNMKKLVLTIVILLVAVLVIIMIQPTSDYMSVLRNPKISPDKKTMFVADKEIRKMGYQTSAFESSLEKDGDNWLVIYVERSQASDKRILRIWIDKNYKLLKVQ